MCVTSDELAGSASVNPVHVRKVLGPLRQAGLIRSHPGARGGWELSADPSSVALAQVWEILRGEEPVFGIHGPNPECAVGVAILDELEGLDKSVAAAISRELGARTLSAVLADAGFEAGQFASE